MDDNDDSILLELQKGRMQAYEKLFKKYYKLLSIEAFHLLKDEMESEDVVQTVFIEIWEKQLYLNIDSCLKNYLRRAVHNRCLTAMNKQKTIKKKFGNYIYNFNEIFYEEPLEHKLDTRFNLILNELPTQRHEAFNLVYLENKKYKEAATEMGITVNSVKTHLRLALKSLRRRFVN